MIPDVGAAMILDADLSMVPDADAPDIPGDAAPWSEQLLAIILIILLPYFSAPNTK